MTHKHFLVAVLLAAGTLGAAAPRQADVPVPDKEWKTWLEDVKPLMLPEEVSAAKQTAPSDRARFRDEFWLLRDPKRESADNEVRTEYEQRVKSAERRFRHNGNGPWNDCGRVFVVLGKPTRVQVSAPIMPSSSDVMFKGEMGGQETWVYRNHPRLPTTSQEFRFPFTNSCEGEGRFDASGRLLQWAVGTYVNRTK